ncbi:carbohydrate ABC transporter substrate-binding protein [Streptomyces hoynatensis]|uniref:Carbohydrate ABC transporter substrate-binding protein n=1 Tax=Streptomyces hoynatensis TaxID=1141874 RepID=A0A3A9Z9G5_9ACTN|nr:carbohydrate ABC transporter substrate-binding protein [Streptomyces hoynatensis]RKN44925.1 carbohydrate ABC transporter substrate-binding protein [Streptomyces hoynatensis]
MTTPTTAAPAATGELRGLTWDHPRGYGPLEELARLDAAVPTGCETVGLPLRWHRQPLSGFESAPIAALAPDYDLLVVDHAALGDAVEAGCLVAMDVLFDAAELATWRARSVGPGYRSHECAGRTWALPLDATAQTAAARPDLMGDQAPPATWEEACALPGRVPLTLCLGGPHAFLTFCALCLAQGEEPLAPGAEAVCSRERGLAALEVMAALAARTPAALREAGPLGVLRAMSAEDGPAYCPLVPGHATFTRSGPYPLAFSAPPAWLPGGAPGSVFGGAGLAVSRRGTGDPAVRSAIRDHLRRLLAEPVQRELFPVTGGQPAARAAWRDPWTNERWGGFYLRTLATVEGAWVRPRRPGYPAFQAAASRLLREGLAAGVPHRALLDELDARHRRTGRR